MRQSIWIWLFLLAIPLVAGGGYVLSQRGSGGAAAAQEPRRPVTVPVSRGNVDKTVTAPGQLIGLEERFLSFPAGGRVETLLVRPGSPMRPGDLLAALETAPLEEALQRAEIRLEQARLAYEEALADAALAAAGDEALINSTRAQVPALTEAELRLAAAQEAENRALAEYQKALDRPWEPEQIRESYRLAYEAEKRGRQLAEADLEAVKRRQWVVIQQVAALESEAERAELNQAALADRGIDPLLGLEVEAAARALAGAVLTAPFEGVVLEVLVRPGEQVQPGQPILLVGDPRAGEVRASVIEEDIPLTGIGLPAEIYFDARPDLLLRGRVDRLVPRRIDGQERPLYAVYLALDEPLPEGVLPGMTADASIIVDSAAGVLRLPRGLVLPRSDGSAEVMVWENGQALRRPIQVGLRGDAFIEITAGLDEGDEVVAE